ncbi:hypothetical protein KSS87_022945 [Heliosperma pusillum]|nr:hypothetical protein KSS87_022945 [Heliosperma pusillum]
MKRALEELGVLEEDDEGQGLADLEAEDHTVKTTLRYVDDQYNPYEDQGWVDECGGYNAKLFKNGFNLVVVKAECNRYTADCATASCGRRIHASVLPDGKTWAIKSIRSPDHGCDGVRNKNPMGGNVALASGSINPDGVLQFKSCFISFHAQFTGLIRGCRSLIGVDGAHLKGNYGGGVEPALEVVWPEAYRRFCARHLCSNFKQEHPGILMHELFWRVVNATNEYTFKKALEMVVQHGGLGAARWFLDLGDKEAWAKHKFDPRLCCEDNTSNFVESFNGAIQFWLFLKIVTVETMLIESEGDGDDIGARTTWEPADFVSEWFTVKRYKEAYGLNIHPISDSAQWPTFNVPSLEPPLLRRAIGRPSRNRRREPWEQRKGKRSIVIKCKKCGCMRHNSKTCKEGLTEKEKGQLRGNVTNKRTKTSQPSSLRINFTSLNHLEALVIGTQTSTSVHPPPTNQNQPSTSTQRPQ